MRQSRNINLLVRPKGVLVTLPFYASYEEALAFLDTRTDWVQKARQRLRTREEKARTKFSPETEFGTYSRKLQLVPDDRCNIRVEIKPDVVMIYYPNKHKVDEPVLQDAIRTAVEYAWRVEAHEVLPGRLQQLAAQHGFSYKKLTIRNTRTCWGSCTADNSINLSLHLMHLPDHLIDYIILHELCHTVHKNHGPRFWKLLDELTRQKAREYAKQLREHSTRIY